MYRTIKDDAGLYYRTKEKADMGKFRTPSLRYTVYTAPYMHNGTFFDLTEVVEFYNEGGGENEFAAAFGDCEAGAEPPLGSLYEMRTILDHRLSGEKITFRGGSHTQTITMALEDYREIVAAEVVDVAVGE